MLYFLLQQNLIITMNFKALCVAASILVCSSSFAFDKVEQHLRDCSNYSNLVIELVSKVNRTFSVQDAMYVHKVSITQFSEEKQEMLNDMFFMAIDMLGKPRAEVKHMLVKQCSH